MKDLHNKEAIELLNQKNEDIPAFKEFKESLKDDDFIATLINFFNIKPDTVKEIKLGTKFKTQLKKIVPRVKESLENESLVNLEEIYKEMKEFKNSDAYVYIKEKVKE